jgi:ABC-type dipeptide/oligopeptide/nickel transport system permease component
MARYIALRLLQGLIVLFLVSSATFGMMHLAPGDPIDMMVGEAEVSQAQIDIITQKWGLDQPVYRQYLTWLGNVLRGDFGTSIIRSGVPVTSMIREALPATLKLNLFALIVSLVIALPVGLLAAVKRYSLFDYLSMGGASLGVALPNFWVALMLIILFGLYLGWLPPFGLSTWKGYILPVAVLATEQMAVLARLMRGTTLEVLRQDYVATARAKGLREVMVIARHVSRNALLPVVTMLGYRIAFILSGTIVVEYVFAIGGIGRLFIDSVFRLDYQVVQALVLLFAALVVLGNLATDVVYAYIDPRIRIR